MKTERIRNGKVEFIKVPEKSSPIEIRLDKLTYVHRVYNFNESDLDKAEWYQDAVLTNPMPCEEPACHLNQWKNKKCWLHYRISQDGISKKKEES